MKYKVIKYYRRSHEQTYDTREQALAALTASGLNRKGEFYAELWEMETEEDGEQVAFFENGIVPMVVK